jgi:cytochrome c oxidase assembly protein subunit 11
MKETGQSADDKRSRHGPVALMLAGLVAAMVGLSFAAVPLYRMFCQVTGYSGVPLRAEAAPAHAIDRNIEVHFDANVDQALPWSFAPVDRQIDVKIGETTLAFFKADNKSDVPVKGTAVFNVVPERAARYFNKIECFCFKEQTLAPKQSVEMPVTFFIDPKIVEDDDTKNISEITLSYTFYRSDAGGKSGS